MAFPVKADMAGFTKVAVGQARSSSLPVAVTVTANATINTYGTYVSLGTTPTDRPTTGIILHQSSSSVAATDTNMCVTLRTVSGTGTIIVEDYYIGAENRNWISHYLPVRVAPNTAVFAATKCATTVIATTLAIDFCTNQMMGGVQGYGRVTAYGVVNSGGTQVTSPVSQNTYTTTPVQMTASTTYPIKAFYLSLTPTPGTTVTAENLMWQVLVGAAASEQILVTDRAWSTFTSESQQIRWPHGLWMGADIPAGTRLSAKLSASAVSKTHGIILYGVH